MPAPSAQATHQRGNPERDGDSERQDEEREEHARIGGRLAFTDEREPVLTGDKIGGGRLPTGTDGTGIEERGDRGLGSRTGTAGATGCRSGQGTDGDRDRCRDPEDPQEPAGWS